MKRDWTLPEDFEAGSEHLALALAEVAGNTLLSAYLELTLLLQRVGGQVYISAYRRKVTQDGQLIPIEDEKDYPGQYQNLGFVINYETRDMQRTLVAKFPQFENGNGEVQLEQPTAELQPDPEQVVEDGEPASIGS